MCIYNLNESTGEVEEIPGCTSALGSYPEHLQVHPTDNYLYVVNSSDGIQGAGAGNLAAFGITPSGLLSTVTTVPAGDYPIKMALNPAGTFAAVVDNVGSHLFIYRIALSGEPIIQGSWPTDEHPFSVVFDHSGTFVYTANFKANNLSIFELDATTGQLTPQGTISTGLGPAALAVFSPQ